MISKREILMRRITEEELSTEMLNNLNTLHSRINKVREAYGRTMVVSSGYRTPAINRRVGGAKNSWHTKCAAVDIFDVDGLLQKWVLANLDFIKKVELYIEDFKYTKGWVHFQIFSPASGNVIFKP